MNKNIISEDIYSKATSVKLVKRGTILTNHIVEKLLLHSINYVRVDKTQGRVQLDDSILTAPVTETADFAQFLGKYDDVLSTFRQQVSLTLQDGRVEEAVLCNIVSNLASSSLNSDVLNFIRFIKQGDDAIYAHSLNVAILCNIMGTWLGMGEKEKSILTMAGMLHDIGKTRVPPEILYKEGKLTDREFQEIKKHPAHGFLILQNSKIPQVVKTATLMHHEKSDGRGYPLGREASHIDHITSIVSVCDIYEAMTANRVYRARESPFSVLEKLQQGNFGLLHAGYNIVLAKGIANSFLGHPVILTTGEKGTIVHLNQQNLSRPLVLCGDKFVDLSASKNISISMVL